MKNLKYFLTISFVTLLSSFCISQVNIKEAQKNAKKQVPDKVTLVKSAPGKSNYTNSFTYSYDGKGRLTQITSSLGDYTFKYSYGTQEYVFGESERVSSITIFLANNEYVKADFTYDKLGALKEIVRTGQQKETLNLKYENDTYTWEDSRRRYHKLNTKGMKILEHKINKDAFIFNYETSGINGTENMLKPITLTTYLAMDYLNTDFYTNGFFQCIMSNPLKSIVDPRENGKMFLFTNKKSLTKYLTESKVKEGEYVNTWSFTYRDPIRKLVNNPIKIENEQININKK